MKKVFDEKCLNCGATLKYNPKKEKFICEYCRGEFSLEDIKKAKKRKTKKNADLTKEFDTLEDINGYHCDNCGAEIITLDNIASTTCVYCKSNAIIKNRLSGVYKPDSIITFKYNKEDAIEEFKKLTKGRLLSPKNFNNLDNIKEMEGLYVPFWLYDCLNDASLTADCTTVTTWMDRRYVYTKTNYYKVERGGILNFVSVPNDAATRFDDTIMNAIEPFNYADLKDFELDYLAGFLSEKYDVTKDKAYLNAKERIEEDSKKCLEQNIKGYDTVIPINNTNQITIQNTKYVLLPVWVLNLSYQGKIYHFAMNGQTGKLVGEIPVDTKKFLLLIILTFLVIFLILLIFFFVIGYRW